VKVALPDGAVLTLPNGVSASGARYTDEREYVWWEKGGTAVLEKRDESGEFRAIGEYSQTDVTR
jgi:membrane-bound inhibitor of C-type lysozyme